MEKRRALIDERIKTLLTTTDLTFKQIIEQLKGESMSVSFNTIRRVNRNHVYRKPRYDAKLTPEQRKKLIVELINTSKPNLSSLARKYGVCHGSIWYWWDKLTKIKKKNNGFISSNELPLEFDQNFISEQSPINFHQGDDEEEDDDDDEYFFNFGDKNNEDELNDNGFLCDPDSDPLDLNYLEDCSDDASVKHNNKRKRDDFEKEQSSTYDLGQVEIVGAVQAKNLEGEFERLPIIMYAPAGYSRKKRQNASRSISGASSSSTNSTPSALINQPGSSIQNLNLSLGF